MGRQAGRQTEKDDTKINKLREKQLWMFVKFTMDIV